MANEFCYLLRVRYSECGAQKVVFNSRYSDYVDLAAGEFMRAIWGDYNDLLSQGVDNQVVSYSINWQAPARFDDVLAITVVPLKIGNSSFSFLVEFHNYNTGLKLASAEIVYVMVSVDVHNKMVIPDVMRKQLEQGAKSISIDHAGVRSS